MIVWANHAWLGISQNCPWWVPCCEWVDHNRFCRVTGKCVGSSSVHPLCQWNVWTGGQQIFVYRFLLDLFYHSSVLHANAAFYRFLRAHTNDDFCHLYYIFFCSVSASSIIIDKWTEFDSIVKSMNNTAANLHTQYTVLFYTTIKS